MTSKPNEAIAEKCLLMVTDKMDPHWDGAFSAFKDALNSKQAEIDTLKSAIKLGYTQETMLFAKQRDEARAEIDSLKAENERFRNKVRAYELDIYGDDAGIKINELQTEVDRLGKQCSELASVAMSNGQDLILHEAKVKQLSSSLAVAVQALKKIAFDAIKQEEWNNRTEGTLKSYWESETAKEALSSTAIEAEVKKAERVKRVVEAAKAVNQSVNEHTLSDLADALKQLGGL